MCVWKDLVKTNSDIYSFIYEGWYTFGQKVGKLQMDAILPPDYTSTLSTYDRVCFHGIFRESFDNIDK